MSGIIRTSVIVAASLLMIAAVACSEEPAPAPRAPTQAPVPAAAPSSATETAAPAPEPAAAPTDTPEPVADPTDTPEPAEAAPIDTPEPAETASDPDDAQLPATPTPMPPTPVPATANPVPETSTEAPDETGVSSLIADFELEDLTVAVGTQVTWRNLDSVRHTSTAVSGEWDSGNLSGSATFSFTFDEVGTFNYYCTIHESMTATVTVTGTAGEVSGIAPDLSATMLVPAPIDVSSLIAEFELEDLTVPVGTKITWRNLDSVQHTSTAVSGEWDSGDLSGSATFTFTFNETGAFPYFCTIHQSMTGTITVVEAVDEMQVEEDTSATSADDTGYGY